MADADSHQRYNAHYGTTGQGHLYQGHYKSFPAQDDEHFLTVCCYVERNAFTTELTSGPEVWRWGSLYRWTKGTAAIGSLAAQTPVELVPPCSDSTVGP